MSNATPLGPVTEPDLRQVLQNLKSEIFYGLNCHQVGTIQSYDPATQLASVLLTIKRVVFNKTQDLNSKLQLENNIREYPLLVDVPVFTLYGGAGRITFPIKKGDTCMVIFNDRDIDNWLISGTAQPPNSQRSHSLSDGFAIVGFRHNRNQFSSIPPDDLQLLLNGGKITIKVNGDQDLMSPAGGEIQIEDKLGIKNSATSLKLVLDQLCTVLTAWVNTGGTTPNPATILAIANLKTLADSLLK